MDACQSCFRLAESCWVEQVLKPYVTQAPDSVIPILFLSSYQHHMMVSVVGVKKPFKGRTWKSWESWMIAEGL